MSKTLLQEALSALKAREQELMSSPHYDPICKPGDEVNRPEAASIQDDLDELTIQLVYLRRLPESIDAAGFEDQLRKIFRQYDELLWRDGMEEDEFKRRKAHIMAKIDIVSQALNLPDGVTSTMLVSIDLLHSAKKEADAVWENYAAVQRWIVGEKTLLKGVAA